MMMKIGKMRDDKKYIGRGIVNILVGIVVSFLLSAVSLCIWHIPTAGFAEQNGRNAKLNGRLPFDY